MAQFRHNLLELDVNKLFEEHTIEEIIEIEDLLDYEIEKKRVELRGMVGDHYKDILVASDAIKTMKDFSEEIVTNIATIEQTCGRLIQQPSICTVKTTQSADLHKNEERSIVIQIRLMMVIFNQIWSNLDDCNYIQAVQLCLLNQYIHTGLQFLPQDTLARLPILKRMKPDIDSLQKRILKNIKEKLQTVELDSEETSSNLIALMLLKRLSNQALNIFVDLRKSALDDVINQSYNSVRLQVTAMMKCLITTVQLLYDCFINWNDNELGLIWMKLEEIVGPNAPMTLTTIELPSTPLLTYIPEILKQFRPKLDYSKYDSETLAQVIEKWLQTTNEMIEKGIREPLNLVTNIRGLDIIREDALRLKFSANWETVCERVLLPKHFHLWFHFFQPLITQRAREVISKKVEDNLSHIQSSIVDILSKVQSEKHLRTYVWIEESADVSQSENKHLGLSMKAKGYSNTIINLCTIIDRKYLEILQDFSLYAYGVEYELKSQENCTRTSISDRKFSDRNDLEKFLGKQCIASLETLITWLLNCVKEISERDEFILKSVFLARFLQAIGSLCPNLIRCCIHSNEWNSLLNNFTENSLKLWQNWLDKSSEYAMKLIEERISCCTLSEMFESISKWDVIEIVEEGEEKTYKSHIRVPFQLSLGLQQVLGNVSDLLDDVIPHTIPRKVHISFVEAFARAILNRYDHLASLEPNQMLSLQLLFDVKFVTIFCTPRENLELISISQNVCDRLRSRVDPFDLDVFYPHLQFNVKQCVLQQQVILGSLLPNTSQLSTLGMLEKSKSQEVDPSVLAVNTMASPTWFQLLPMPTQTQRSSSATMQQSQSQQQNKSEVSKTAKSQKKSSESVRSGAAAFFGAVANDWFS